MAAPSNSWAAGREALTQTQGRRQAGARPAPAMAVRLARLLFALAISSLPTQSDQTRTIMAINAGGDTTIAADGEVYERDRYYQGGVVSKKGKDLVINGTNSPALYQVRFAPSKLNARDAAQVTPLEA